MTLADAINAELGRRRTMNARYSLRGFARALHVSHSSLSRLSRGHRPSARVVDRLGRRLGWSDRQIREVVAGHRVDRLRDVAAARGFVADARWIAARTGLSLDDVHIALHEAVRTRRLAMTSAHAWTVGA